MKLQIDTVAKTIKLEQSAKFSELLIVVKKLFPNDQWKEYTLDTCTVINNWTNPIVIDRWPIVQPIIPSWNPLPYDVCFGDGLTTKNLEITCISN